MLFRSLLSGGAVTLEDSRLREAEEEVAVRDGQVVKAGRRRWFRIEMP